MLQTAIIANCTPFNQKSVAFVLKAIFRHIEQIEFVTGGENEFLSGNSDSQKW